MLLNFMAYYRHRTTLEVYLLYSFSTLTLERVEWPASNPDRFTLEEVALGAIEKEARWAPELVWRV
jgi:hypothetical protein